MNKVRLIFFLLEVLIFWTSISFRNSEIQSTYIKHYHKNLDGFILQQQKLIQLAGSIDLKLESDIEKLKTEIYITRKLMKGMDLWFRYLEPISQKKINGPLPVEWETEAFEKFEKPYKREGAGLALAFQYINEGG